MIDPISIMMTVASMASSMMAARQQQRAQRAAAQQQLNEMAKAKWEEYEKQEKLRQDMLKKTLAKRRARMGAHGLSAADGSAGAIIQGLRTDTAEQTYNDYSDKKASVDKRHESLTSNLMEASKEQRRGLYRKAGAAVEGLTGVSGISTLVDYGTSDHKNPMDLLEGVGNVAGSLHNKFDTEQ